VKIANYGLIPVIKREKREHRETFTHFHPRRALTESAFMPL